ncbi:MAG: hypothetical protein LBJ70_02165 [Holosporales bacterium]|nr:hypothetical protein [Holosporales bacterium]
MKVQRLMVMALLAVGGMACAQETADKGGFYVGVGGHYANVKLSSENFAGVKEKKSDNMGGAAVSVFVGCFKEYVHGFLLGVEGHCAISFAEKEINYSATQKITHSFSSASPSTACVIGCNTSLGSICLTAGVASLRDEVLVKTSGKWTYWGVAPELGAFYEYRILKSLGLRVGGSYAFGAHLVHHQPDNDQETSVSADRLCVSACVVYHF